MDVQLPDGSVLQGVPDGITKVDIAKKLKLAGNPNWEPIAQAAMAHQNNPVTNAVGESALSALTGGVATLAAGARSAFDLVTGQGTRKAEQDIHSTQDALTYQPKTPEGKAASAAINYLPQKLGEASDKAGMAVTKATGSKALGAVTDTALQTAPVLLSEGVGRIGAAKRATAEEAAAATRAKNYVSSRTSLDWNSLSDRFKKTLTTLAKDAKNLTQLDPRALERSARLERLGLPATRGQVTRDLSQITSEENLTKTDAGADIRNVNAEQDRILHEHLDTLRGQTGGKAATPGQLGQSVQGAARAKLSALKDDYRTAYEHAEDAGETAAPVDLKPLNQWMANPTNRLYSGYIKTLIKNYAGRGQAGKFIPKGTIGINDLEEIRKAVTSTAKDPGPTGHFAKEALGVIDDVLDRSGGDFYKNARAKFRAVKDEFDRQQRVSGLVKNKGMSRDRAVALEDTFDTVVLKGSNEQLQSVRDTLTKGGTPETLKKGQQAWRDLQAATIDHLKSKAAGKRAIQGEQGQLQFNSTFLDALHDLQQDGKLDTLFGAGTTARLQELAQATRDVRTKPTGRIAGSDTAPRILNFLEKISSIPVVGKPLAGAVGVAKKVSEIGGQARESARAKKTPMQESAEQVAARKRRTQTLQSASLAAAGSLTLKDNDQ